MHEFAAVKQMIEILLEKLPSEQIEEVMEVTIHVGEFRFLNADQLQLAYEILSKDTILEGSILRIKKIKGEVGCSKCGYKGKIRVFEDPIYHMYIPSLNCPECGERAKILKGNGFILKSVKVKYKENEETEK